MRRSVAFLTLLRIRFWTANEKKLFLDGPRAPRSTIKKKKPWGSGDENVVQLSTSGDTWF